MSTADRGSGSYRRLPCSLSTEERLLPGFPEAEQASLGSASEVHELEVHEVPVFGPALRTAGLLCLPIILDLPVSLLLGIPYKSGYA